MLELENAVNLFHYTTAEAAFTHILPEGKLRFSLYQEMRDPLENKSWQLAGAGYGPASDRDKVEQVMRINAFDGLANKIRERSHLISFSVDAIPVETREVEPFSLGWARARMWEQYADNHRGVCLVFDRARLQSAVTESLEAQNYAAPYADRVLYEPGGMLKPLIEPAELVDEDVDRSVRTYIERNKDILFFSKALDWQTEFEFRFVTTSTDGEPIFVEFGDALVAVLLGEAFPLWQHQSVESACAELEAEVAQLDWSRGRPRLADLHRIRVRARGPGPLD